MKPEDLKSYYSRCHRALEGTGAASLQWAFDTLLDWDFKWNDSFDSNKKIVNLARAYFGYPQDNADIKRLCQGRLGHILDVEEEKRLLGGIDKPYDRPLKPAQREAISKALEMPISFVQGPPGTGKTAVITRLLALAVERGMKVAVVSANAAAVRNVAEALDAAAVDGGDNALTRAAKKYALLGNAIARAEWRGNSEKFSFSSTSMEIAPMRWIDMDDDQLTIKGGEYATVKGWEQNIEFGEFTSEYPIVMSTIHSLRKLFKDGYKSASKYDLLIMDEASQTRLDIGATVLGAAKRMVLFGDTKQLSPVMPVSTDAKKVLGELSVEQPHCFLKPETSFLSMCLELWGSEENTTMLVDHFRCHPGIIEFCNQEIYDGQLVIHSPNPFTGVMEPVNRNELMEQPVPITILYYQGEYLERCEVDGGRPSYRNLRQVTILREEFADAIMAQVQDGNTVALLSPYRGQTAELKKVAAELKTRIEEEIGSAVDLSVRGVTMEFSLNANVGTRGDSGQNNQEEDEEQVISLVQSRLCEATISRAQGREFDYVYLFPTEDGIQNPTRIWAQNKRLINVAVSRAKRGLYAVISSRMLLPVTQLKLTGVVYERERKINSYRSQDPKWNNASIGNHCRALALAERDLFVCNLVEYVKRHNGVHQRALSDEYFGRGFGIFPSRLGSIFDITLRSEYNVRGKDSDGQTISRPQEAITQELQRLVSSPAFAKFNLEVRSEAAVIHFWDTSIELQEWLNQDGNRHFVTPDKWSGVKYVDVVVVNKYTDQLVLAVEVDGSFHRVPQQRLSKIHQNDKSKDKYLQDLGAFLLRGNEIPSNWPPSANNSFILWRIPTDGSTVGETEKLGTSDRLSMDEVLEEVLKHPYRRVIKHLPGTDGKG